MSDLFLKIIDMSISASWLVLAVLLLRLILKKAPKWVNVLLWGIVAVRLICPFALESSVSLIPDSVGNGEFVSEWADDYIGDMDFHHSGSEHYDAAVGAGRVPISDGAGGYYVVTKHDQLGEPSTIKNTVVPVLAIVWASGIALLALYTVASYWRLRRKVSEAVILRDNIFQSENIASPFVLGIIKPKVYLPYNMDEQNLSHVIAHEQAHIRRRDHWWKPLGFLLLTIHWFNPLMWLAYVLLCRDIELACDEKVIQELGNEQRADYSQALVSCSVNRRIIAACPLAFGEVGVKERVKSVMNYKKPAFWVMLVSIIACVVVAVCFLTNPINAIEGEYRIEGYGIYNNGKEYYIVVNDGVELKCTAEQYEQIMNLMERFHTGEIEDTPVHVTYKQFLISYKRGTVIDLEIPREILQDESFGKTYVYAKEGFGGSFTITLYEDGTFSYYEGMLSSYIALGSWKQDGDIITLTDDGHGGYGLVNHFKFDSETLTFVEKGSDNFVYLKVKDGEKFHCTGESFKQIHATDGAVQIMPSQKLSLNDVIILSQKGYDLTWSDFDDYAYIETGSGLYIRVYEINEMYELWIGGGGPDSAPMYIYLALADDLDTRIDIRDGGVTEFIGTDHSEALLNRAIYDAIINCNRSEKTLGLNHCASFVMLGKEEISGTSVAGSNDHAGTIIVYGLALHQGYDIVGENLQEVEGSHTPVAITFHVKNGKYSLKEYWRPGDGSYYVSDVREKFPDGIEDDALDTQKYILAQIQECYAQAVAANGIDTASTIEQLFEIIESSPATSSRPADYIDAHPIEYRELTYYGSYTLQYVFSKFLEGDQTGLRGHLMRSVLDDLAPEAQLRLYAETGQEYFDEWKAGAIRISEQHDMEWIKEHQPAIWLFLQMDVE